MNKKQLYESIMSSVSKEVKKALLEYRTKSVDTYDINLEDVEQYLKTTLQQWIYTKIKSIQGLYYEFWSLGNSGAIYVYIGSIYPNQPINITITNTNKSGYRDIRPDLQKIQDYLKGHKEFQITSSRIARDERLECRYFVEKDKDLYDAIQNAKNKFEQDVEEANTDEFAPTERDWIKMVGYMNNHSNPERVAKSCKEPRKIVARYIIARTLGWDEAAHEFKYKILSEHILSEAQLEAYRRKYATYNIPDDIKELIEDFKEADETGGLNRNIEHAYILTKKKKKYIHDNINIKSYTIEIPEDKNVIPIKKTGRYRSGFGYNYIPVDTAKCAILHITLINGQTKDLLFVYKHNNNKQCFITTRDLYNISYFDNNDFQGANPKTSAYTLDTIINQ